MISGNYYCLNASKLPISVTNQREGFQLTFRETLHIGIKSICLELTQQAGLFPLGGAHLSGPHPCPGPVCWIRLFFALPYLDLRACNSI